MELAIIQVCSERISRITLHARRELCPLAGFIFPGSPHPVCFLNRYQSVVGQQRVFRTAQPFSRCLVQRARRTLLTSLYLARASRGQCLSLEESLSVRTAKATRAVWTSAHVHVFQLAGASQRHPGTQRTELTARAGQET